MGTVIGLRSSGVGGVTLPLTCSAFSFRTGSCCEALTGLELAYVDKAGLIQWAVLQPLLPE